MKAALQSPVDVLPIGALVPSPTNPRKRFDPTALAELETSVTQHGILQPLLVRAIDMRTFEGHIEPADAQVYEIIDGERRYRVAKSSGVEKIPVHVIDATDDQVREMQVVMNLQRQDVHPLEEADGYAELMQHLGSTTAVAARVGKDIAYITGRLKLRTLIEFSRQAFSNRLITLDHALLLAKLGDEEQERALRYAVNRGATKREKTEDVLREAAESLAELNHGYHRYWEPTSVNVLKEHIEDELQLGLKKAPWDLADAELLPSAGACTTCPSNTAANTALFGDLAIEEATCTDATCFSAKRQKFVELKLAVTQEAGTVAVKFSWRSSGAKPKWAKDDSGPDLKTTFKQGQWVEAKKGECANVVLGISVDYDEREASRKPGQKKLICVASGCKAHKKEYEKAKSQRGVQSSYNAEEEKKKREDQERLAKAEEKLRIDHVKSALTKISKLTPALLKAWAHATVREYEQETLQSALGKGYSRRVQAVKPDSAEFARIVFAVLIERSIAVSTYNFSPAEGAKGTKKLLETLKAFTGYVPPKPKGKK